MCVPHSCVCHIHDAFLCMPWRIQCDLCLKHHTTYLTQTNSSTTSHASFMCVPRLIRVYATCKNHSCVCHHSFMCVPRLIHMCTMTGSYGLCSCRCIVTHPQEVTQVKKKSDVPAHLKRLVFASYDAGFLQHYTWHTHTNESRHTHEWECVALVFLSEIIWQDPCSVSHWHTYQSIASHTYECISTHTRTSNGTFTSVQWRRSSYVCLCVCVV